MSDRRLFRTKSILVASLAIIVIGTLAASVLIAARLRHEALDRAYDAAAMHSRAFEDHLTLSLQAVDITIKGVALSQLPQGGGSAALFDILRNAPHLRSVSLLDGGNRVFASSNPANVGLVLDIAAYFPPARENTEQLRIGAPVAARDLANTAARETAGAGPVNGYIPVLRTLAGRDGPVVVLAALNADYFLNHFSQELEAIGGRVRLVRYDGLPLLSNTPAAEPADSWPALAARLESREFDAFDHASAAGTHYVTAYHASRLYPFAVAVQLARDEALARWLRETRIVAAMVLPLLAAIVLLGVIFYRRQRHFIAQDIANGRARRLAASVFESSHDAVLLTDPQANLLVVNRAFTEMNGYTAAEVVGRNPRLLSSGAQEPAFFAEMWRAINDAGFWQGEVVNQRKDGTRYDALLSITPVRDAGGALLHYVGTCSDISGRKAHEQQLIDARDRAEAGARAKAAFLAAMSHEIRTPMNGIIGMTELALMTSAPEKIRRYLTVAKSSADSLMIILNDILDFSKAEAGRLTLERRPFDPAAVVAEVADLFAGAALGKGIELKRVIGAGLPARIEGDEVRVRQILTNLLSNAIKFTEHGHAAIGLALAPDGAALEFSVADTGIGVAADLREYIFAPFAQADASTTRKYGGTGLGLAVCKQLADLMRGRLSVESAPGLGSRFIFFLPLEGVPEGAARVAAEADLGAAGVDAARQAGAPDTVAEIVT